MIAILYHGAHFFHIWFESGDVFEREKKREFVCDRECQNKEIDFEVKKWPEQKKILQENIE